MTKKKLQLERHQFGPLPVVWITRLPGESMWATQADYYVETPWGEVFIPIGFRFDLASVPRWAWWLIAPFELSLVAPLVHDYLYHQAGYMDDGISWPAVWDREDADDLFLWLMERERVPAWRAKLAHRAVRGGGGIPWRKVLRKMGRKGSDELNSAQ